jgi:chaperone required for assembly of F1-ATPase
MTAWTAKRFWKAVTVEDAEGGYAIRLDARPLRTPAKHLMCVPTSALADAVASEWDAVESVVDPRRMPFTRSANAAIDKVAPQFAEVAALIADYGATDLLCYRAEEPEPLVARQAAAWDPILDWAERRFGVRLTVTRGVVPVAQAPQSVATLAAVVNGMTPFELTALHDLVSMSGSLLIGLAATEADSDPAMLWRLSRIDEEWQAELWGQDEEATKAAEAKGLAFLHAYRFWQSLHVA